MVRNLGNKIFRVRLSGMQYFFDLRYGTTVALDDEGRELPDVAAAQVMAARILSDTVLQAMVETQLSTKRMAIEVRDERGPVLQCLFAFESERLTPQPSRAVPATD
jgi:hypothetical protein